MCEVSGSSGKVASGVRLFKEAGCAYDGWAVPADCYYGSCAVVGSGAGLAG